MGLLPRSTRPKQISCALIKMVTGRINRPICHWMRRAQWLPPNGSAKWHYTPHRVRLCSRLHEHADSVQHACSTPAGRQTKLSQTDRNTGLVHLNCESSSSFSVAKFSLVSAVFAQTINRVRLATNRPIDKLAFDASVLLNSWHRSGRRDDRTIKPQQSGKFKMKLHFNDTN